MTTCQHPEVRPWQQDQVLNPDAIIGGIPINGTHVMFGGWRCTACGERFYPKSLVGDMLRQAHQPKEP